MVLVVGPPIHRAPHILFQPCHFTSLIIISPRNSYRFPRSSSKCAWEWERKLGAAPSPSPYLSFRNRNRRILKISAHFGRSRTRHNFLRKKLAQDPKVRLIFDHFSPNSDSEFNKDITVEAESGICDAGPAASQHKALGESLLRNKLDSWVDQYQKEVELWGFGSDPIFTVFLDSNGNVKRVGVDEDEIRKRSWHMSLDYESSEELNLKVLRAKSLARDMEIGHNVIPRNSSVAKFVVPATQSGFIDTVRHLCLPSHLIPKPNVAGKMVVLGFVAVLTVKYLFGLGRSRRKVQFTQSEKEMLNRKMKSRKEKELLVKGHVEVLEAEPELLTDFSRRPKLNMQELLDRIRRAKTSKSESALALQDRSSINSGETVDKIQEIREMARRAKEIEASEPASPENDGDKYIPKKELGKMEAVYANEENEASNVFPSGNPETGDATIGTQMNKLLPEVNGKIQISSASDRDFLDYKMCCEQDVTDSQSILRDTGTSEIIPSVDSPDNELREGITTGRKPRIMKSVKEAREYLCSRVERCSIDQQNPSVAKTEIDLRCDSGKDSITEQRSYMDKKFSESDSFGESSDMMDDVAVSKDLSAQKSEFIPNNDNNSVNTEKQSGPNGSSTSDGSSGNTRKWIEENFDEVAPVVEKIAAGFKDNYMAAREKVSQNKSVVTEMSQLGFVEDESEFEWMKDDRLREIVFQVRENELMGRDPFYSMDAEDKRAFFEGLEKKVIKENEKMLNLHEFLHSNIENLDYGADGISVYDPPEKIVPRWKGPTLEKNPEFLKSYLEDPKAFMNEKAGTAYPIKKDEQINVLEPRKSSAAINLKNSGVKDSKRRKTIIEGSDGSVKPGKKSGKEYWQHTKKHSRGFLDSYNAETDPEVKSVMKDVGKDLDRWITEKDMQEAADLMNEFPERNKKFIQKKVEKLKREMELFGPQAVVSKYQEYVDDEEQDYLWWLDLPHVLCIELYVMESGEQKIGFYTLEMAQDLEFDPKPQHVIAFEDSLDCKNFCYIIQAHLEMLGSGHAFVVPRPPKDAFREAKANGFGVTVIRKGEMLLNIDQTLEEVEELIIEIGSKMYHDKIMKERSVDINGVMKGIFGVSGKPRSRILRKRKLKKPSRKPK